MQKIRKYSNRLKIVQLYSVYKYIKLTSFLKKRLFWWVKNLKKERNYIVSKIFFIVKEQKECKLKNANVSRKRLAIKN